MRLAIIRNQADGIQVEVIGAGALLTIRRSNDDGRISGSFVLKDDAGDLMCTDFHTVGPGWITHPWIPLALDDEQAPTELEPEVRP